MMKFGSVHPFSDKLSRIQERKDEFFSAFSHYYCHCYQTTNMHYGLSTVFTGQQGDRSHEKGEHDLCSRSPIIESLRCYVLIYNLILLVILVPRRLWSST